MAITQNRVPIVSSSNKVNTGFITINSSDYTTTKIQDNVQKLSESLISKINNLPNNVAIAYSTTDITIASSGAIIFPKYFDQNTVYDYSTGSMTCVFSGPNLISCNLNVTGDLQIQIWVNGTPSADVIDGSGVVSYYGYLNISAGDVISLRVISGTGSLTGYANGLGCQFCLGW